MAYIEKRGGRYRVLDRPGGRGTPKVLVAIVDSKALALVLIDKICTDKKARKPMPAYSVMPITEVIERWRLDQLANDADPDHSITTVKRLHRAIRELGWSTTADATAECVSRWKQEGGKQRSGAFVRAVMSWACDFLRQPVDPYVLVALRPQPGARKPLGNLPTVAAVTALQKRADIIGPNISAFIHCQELYGWRPISAGRAKVSAVDLDAARVTLRCKGRKIITHGLLPETTERLRAAIAGRGPDEPLFLNPRTGRGFTPDGHRSAYAWFRSMRCGGIYDLKRYAITNALETMTPHEVCIFTGQSPDVVYLYVRGNQRTQERALEKLSDARAILSEKGGTEGARIETRCNLTPDESIETTVKSTK